MPSHSDGSQPLDSHSYGDHDVDPNTVPRVPRPRWEASPGADGLNELHEPDGPPMVALHPNLARIAVKYERVRTHRIQGRLSRTEADIALSELIARDDHGVMWTINPQDGGWLYLSKSNEWTPSQPPTSGVATANAYALDRAAGTGVRFDNPDLAIVWVDPEPDEDPWTGAIIRRPEPVQYRRPAWVYPLIVFGVSCVVAFLAFQILGARNADVDTPVETPTTVAVVDTTIVVDTTVVGADTVVEGAPTPGG